MGLECRHKVGNQFWGVTSTLPSPRFLHFFSEKTIIHENSFLRLFPDYFHCSRPFTFTGKERDTETGYSYFGARYYDSDLSGLFLCVDPMSDKYPNLSPYAYCAWNPVKLVDPDGKDVWEVDGNGYITRKNANGGEKKQLLRFSNGTVVSFRGKKYHSIIKDLSCVKGKTSSTFGDAGMQDALTNVFLAMADNTNVEWRLDRYKGNNYGLGTKHTEEESLDSKDVSGGRYGDSDLITMVHSHPLYRDWENPTSQETEFSSMGYSKNKPSINSDKVRKVNHARNVNYYTYFPRTRELWAVGVRYPIYIRKIKSYKSFFFGTINSK